MSRGPGEVRDTGRPLAGQRVLVTRAAGQSRDLVERLRARGAEVVEIPLLAIALPADPRPFREAIRDIEGYDWLLLTSANATHAFADAAGGRLPNTVRVASAGPATSSAIRSFLPGVPIAVQATSAFGAEGLARALALVDVTGSRMLFPVSDRSPATLADTLRARQARVDVLVAYRTTVAEAAGPDLCAALDRGIDAVTFASPSAVEAFVLLRGMPRDIPAVVIGPTTAAATRSRGIFVADMAEPETAEGLAAAVERCLLRTP